MTFRCLLPAAFAATVAISPLASFAQVVTTPTPTTPNSQNIAGQPTPLQPAPSLPPTTRPGSSNGPTGT
ncbi:MAG: hypothetical protein JWR00_4435, partial [Rubritepida sp.]|nr:hypothetical protein [Rubritepida sp.]